MFRLAEAFIEFVTRGYQEAVSQLANAGAEAAAFGAAAVAAAGQSEALSNAMVLIGADAAQAAVKVNVLSVSVNRLRTELSIMGETQRRIGGAVGGPGVHMGPSPMQGIGGAGIAGFLSGPSGPKQITRDWDEATSAVMRFVRGLAQTGIGGSVFSMLSAGIMGMANAAKAATAALAAMGITLTISTGGLFAILAGIVAALVAIGAAFKAAFAADPAAQAAMRELVDGLRSILAFAGGPLVDAFKAIVVPLARAVDLTDRLVRAMDRLTNQTRAFNMVLQLSMIGLNSVLALMEAAADAMGIPRSARGDGQSGGQVGGRVGLEDLEKQLSQAINNSKQSEMQARAVAAAERTADNTSQIAGNTVPRPEMPAGFA